MTCCEAQKPGDKIVLENNEIVVVEMIPIYHKLAIKDINAGEYVYKYGQPIGLASKDIKAGQHVHVHNIESDRGRGDKAARGKV